MANAEKAFVGKFKETLEDFIRHKRNLGYKYENTRENLLRFSEYTLNYTIDNNCLSKELVLKWTAKRKNETVKTWKNRVSFDKEQKRSFDHNWSAVGTCSNPDIAFSGNGGGKIRSKYF